MPVGGVVCITLNFLLLRRLDITIKQTDVPEVSWKEGMKPIPSPRLVGDLIGIYLKCDTEHELVPLRPLASILV